MNLRSDLVTLSACDTGSGNTFGQEGVANLVRPVLAAVHEASWQAFGAPTIHSASC